MIVTKIAVFASLMGVGQGQIGRILDGFGFGEGNYGRAQPPYWPEGCRSLDVKPQIRDQPPYDPNLLNLDYNGPSLIIYPCVFVGEPCKTRRDCTTPPKSECHKNIQDRSRVRGEKSKCIDGYCRTITDKAESACDCLTGCDTKAFDRDLSCVNGLCKAAPCAPCGEFQNNRACCAPGVKGHDGRCFCGTGVGEGCGTNPSKCNDGRYNDVCCGKGTDNEGLCCSEDTCNGRCEHANKNK